MRASSPCSSFKIRFERFVLRVLHRPGSGADRAVRRVDEIGDAERPRLVTEVDGRHRQPRGRVAGLFGLHVVDDKADFHRFCSTSSRREECRQRSSRWADAASSQNRGNSAGGPTMPLTTQFLDQWHVLERDLADVERFGVVPGAEIRRASRAIRADKWRLW